tara:strand:- start:471 stop:836 length:366 start_codon:yes stop_codon:yes gene_type:complete
MKLTNIENSVLNEIFDYTLWAANGVTRKELTIDDIDDICEAYIDARDIANIVNTGVADNYVRRYHSIEPILLIKMSKQSIGGVLTSLQKKGFVFPDECVESEHGLMQFCITQDGMKHCMEK